MIAAGVAGMIAAPTTVSSNQQLVTAPLRSTASRSTTAAVAERAHAWVARLIDDSIGVLEEDDVGDLLARVLDACDGDHDTLGEVALKAEFASDVRGVAARLYFAGGAGDDVLAEALCESKLSIVRHGAVLGMLDADDASGLEDFENDPSEVVRTEAIDVLSELARRARG